MAGNRRGAQTLEKGLRVLDILVEGDTTSGLGLTEISQRLGWHKSTVHRLLQALRSQGYVQQDAQTERYRLGFKVLRLATALLNGLELRAKARPFLVDLMGRTSETVHLTVLDQDEIVYIDKVDSPQLVRMHSAVGNRMPVYCTACGKAILAYSSKEMVDRVVAKGLTPRTPNTITSADVLWKELEAVRQRGYAIDRLENEEGIWCVGAPVFDHSGVVVAAVSISAPEQRMTEERIARFGQAVKETVAQISRELGFRH
ncbi:MAG: IclR family transcriptional regulator [Chloroflexi bacterium]|nr:IclR family transcriptional regulator [Chloroflexota bacterium]